MADQRRQQRFADEIRNQAGKFFSKESLAGTLVTITDVTMSPDLNYADIRISVLPSDRRVEALEQARKALPGLRRQIGDNIRLRKVPELRLAYDNRSEARKRVENVLSEELETEELSLSPLKRILKRLAWWRS